MSSRSATVRFTAAGRSTICSSPAKAAALYDALTAIVGPLHRQHLAGEPGFAASLLQDDETAERYARFLLAVVAAGRRA